MRQYDPLRGQSPNERPRRPVPAVIKSDEGAARMRIQLPLHIHATRHTGNVFVIHGRLIGGGAHLRNPPSWVFDATGKTPPRSHLDGPGAELLLVTKAHPAVMRQDLRPAFDIGGD